MSQVQPSLLTTPQGSSEPVHSRFSRYLSQFEVFFCIYGFLFFAGGLTLTVRQTLGYPVSQGDPITTLLNFATLLMLCALVLLRYKLIIKTLLQGWGLWVLVGVCMTSVGWSVDTGITIDRLITFLMVTLFGLYVASRFTLQEQVRYLAWACVIMVFGSFLFVVALPKYGIMGRGGDLNSQALKHAGAWRGIFVHKNVLGRVLGLATLTLQLQALQRRPGAWVFWLGWLITGLVSVGSQSKTALGMFLILSLIVVVMSTLRWKYVLSLPVWIIALSASFGGYVALSLAFEAILAFFGRDASLSGRSEIWAAAFIQIGKRPLLGYGFSAFWDESSLRVLNFWRDTGFDASNAHNGFIDLLLDLGVVGLVLFSICFVILFWRSLMWSVSSRDASGLFPTAMLFYLLITNMSESPLLQDNLIWAVFVISYLTLASRKPPLVNLKRQLHQQAQFVSNQKQEVARQRRIRQRKTPPATGTLTSDGGGVD